MAIVISYGVAVVISYGVAVVISYGAVVEEVFSFEINFGEYISL